LSSALFTIRQQFTQNIIFRLGSRFGIDVEIKSDDYK